MTEDNDMHCVEREALICVAERYSVERGRQQDRTYVPARTLVIVRGYIKIPTIIIPKLPNHYP